MAGTSSRTQKIHTQCPVAQLIPVHGTKPSQRPVTCTLSSKSVLTERKTLTEKAWQPVGRILIRKMHHYALIAAICMLRQALVPIIPMVFDAVTVWAAVAMKLLLRVAHRYTHTVHLWRDTEQGGTWGDKALEDTWGDEDTCTRGATSIAVGCQGIVTLPDLHMNLALMQSLHIINMDRGSCGHQ